MLGLRWPSGDSGQLLTPLRLSDPLKHGNRSPSCPPGLFQEYRRHVSRRGPTPGSMRLAGAAAGTQTPHVP